MFNHPCEFTKKHIVFQNACDILQNHEQNFKLHLTFYKYTFNHPCEFTKIHTTCIVLQIMHIFGKMPYDIPIVEEFDAFTGGWRTANAHIACIRAFPHKRKHTHIAHMRTHEDPIESIVKRFARVPIAAMMSTVPLPPTTVRDGQVVVLSKWTSIAEFVSVCVDVDVHVWKWGFWHACMYPQRPVSFLTGVYCWGIS